MSLNPALETERVIGHSLDRIDLMDEMDGRSVSPSVHSLGRKGRPDCRIQVQSMAPAYLPGCINSGVIPVEKLRQSFRDKLEGMPALEHVQFVKNSSFFEFSSEGFVHFAVEGC